MQPERADMNKDLGASADAEPGSRPTDQVPEGLGGSRFDPARIEPRPNFNEFSQALLIAAGIYNDVELAFWLTAPQPLLDMWTPIQLLARGDGPELLRVMQGLEDGVYV